MRILLFFLILTSLRASPWPLGENNRYLSLIYGIAEYDQLFFNRRRVAMSSHGHTGKGIPNESLSLHFQTGLNIRDTLLVSVQASNIGPMLDLGGPKHQGFSDAYIGFKRNTKYGKISQGYELGYLLPGSYQEEAITSPGYGAHEIHATWHWAKAYSRKSALIAAIKAKIKAGPVPHSLGLTLQYQRRLNNGWNAQFLFSAEDAFGTVNLFDTSSGWPQGTNTAFHEKDEFQKFVGLGISKSLREDLNLFWLAAHKISYKNTDASRISHTLGVGYSF
ncbi:hypothetical protein HOF92_11420 [bacterium]|nr:hypothetical protein [bacterium]